MPHHTAEAVPRQGAVEPAYLLTTEGSQEAAAGEPSHCLCLHLGE